MVSPHVFNSVFDDDYTVLMVDHINAGHTVEMVSHIDGMYTVTSMKYMSGHRLAEH